MLSLGLLIDLLSLVSSFLVCSSLPTNLNHNQRIRFLAYSDGGSIAPKNAITFKRPTCIYATKEISPITEGGNFRPSLFSQEKQRSVLSQHTKLGVRKLVVWDANQKKFILEADDDKFTFKNSWGSLKCFLVNCFLPSGLMSPDYYKYTLWRMTQRFVSATINVFGTQALLLALGFKQSKLGLAAATTWVLKDALGKVSRIFWASKNGKRFDSDAKRWRFRSSLLFATGNALEIFTYIFPSLFLVIAAVANALKQMSMLTSSATRNAIYKSFARNSDNIGDITAKGEAQIAVIDLLGMLVGILISRAIGPSRSKIAAIFTALSAVDLVCIFNEIKSVVFNSLNYERAGMVLKSLVQQDYSTAIESNSSSSQGSDSLSGGLEALKPEAIARGERIFKSCPFGEDIFCCWTTISAETEVVQGCAELFLAQESEKIIVTLSSHSVKSLFEMLSIVIGIDCTASVRQLDGRTFAFRPQVLLHKEASHFDVFRSLVIVHRINHLISQRTKPVEIPHVADPHIHNETSENILNNPDSSPLSHSELIDIVKQAYDFEKRHIDGIINTLQSAGWDMSKFMFGSINTRVEW